MLKTKISNLAQIMAVAIAFMLPLSTTLTDVFFILAALFTIISYGGNLPQFQYLYQDKIIRLLLGVFLLFLGGMIYTVVPWHEAWHMVSKYDKFLLAPLMLPLFTTKKWRNAAILAFFIAIILTLILSYLKAFGIINNFAGHGNDGFFKDHIQQNFLMAFAAYLCAWYAVQYPRYLLPLMLLMVAIIFNALFLSEGRSGYIVLAALTALWLWQTLKWRGLIYAFIGIIIAMSIAFLGSHHFNSRMQEIVSDVHQYQQGNEQTSMGLRMDFWQNSLKIIKERPLLGGGTGSFTYLYSNLTPQPKTIAHNPHNEYLNIMVQLGAVGLCYILYLFYYIWHRSHLLPNSMSFLAQAVLVSIAIGCLANSWLMDTTEGHFFSYFIVLAFASFYQTSNKINSNP